MINTLLLPELREMLTSGDTEGLREFSSALHPARAAEFMEGLNPQEAWQVLQAADSNRQAELFGFLPDSMQVDILETVSPTETSSLVADLPADDRVDLISDVHPDVVEEMLPLLPAEERRETLRLMEFPEGTAGSVMTTEVARLSETLTVHQALEAIARQSEDLETVYYNYIVDEDNRLRGLISARQLVTHFGKPNTKITDLMQRDVVTVLATDDQETVAAKVASFDFIAIPVVDDHQHLLGIITHDDIIDVLREEATEDAHMAAAVDPLDDSYLETHWFTLAWKRGMWLSILFLGALFTAFALGEYQGEFERVPWLVLFIPLVISSGGNSGSQSATLVITAMTHGDVKLSDWWRVIKREVWMGFCLGSMLAIGGYLCAMGILSTFEPDDPQVAATFQPPSWHEVLVVPITLVLVVICSTLCGGTLPMIFRRLGLDPALMSNPFVAGIIDIAGIVIYMNVAAGLLSSMS
ncbi:magnesium transporter [Aeoliella mucimassa]|uniref:Magnesium transporter MgtE n=1 Tax=Aeoliella mucimassa TaxID=2527972 RepID=A0A518AK75_9BACT|nr:magnesium transporter [Aeoliella mucimassa]QDU55140.1 Magnesium transporter MgtE [Aeoliella mucimassa]